ncbi:SPOR domain-containing protein [Octadecabacter sp. SW4]|uniref:SPOR domain-containing protein n=1 Tax=Octadecabacter sp. SW4 TaxID=2602067 RepID=UPI0020C7A382|nr:SPOR domain-containing protein [Octadecabacter sp. SW4]
MKTRVFLTATIVAMGLGGAAMAQALRNADGPAETPPASFTANQYVDSRGCVYIRAGISGNVTWVPRVNRSRRQLCGFEPSLGGATQVATATPTPAPAPVPTPTPQAPAPTPVVAPAPQPAPAARQTPPAAIPQPAPVTPTPRVVATPAPEPAPRTMTRSEFCEGRSGPQPGFISDRTGETIVCGAPAVTQVAAVVPPTLQPTPATAPQPTPATASRPRLSRAEACADSAATGRQYASTLTGALLQCGPQTGAVISASVAGTIGSGPLVAPSGRTPVNRATACADMQATGRRYVSTSTGLPLDCGSQGGIMAALFGWGRTPTVPTTRAVQPEMLTYGRTLGTAAAPRSCTSIGMTGGTGYGLNCQTSPEIVTRSARGFGRTPPYSNPEFTGAWTAARAPVTPDGYTKVWDDGRLNSQRGLPEGNAQGLRQPEATPATRVSTRSVQQPAATADRFVQVATYASRADAQRVAQGLRAQGLPMRIGVYTRGGTEYRIVMAGPFNSATALQSALNTVRGAGYSGASTRN